MFDARKTESLQTGEDLKEGGKGKSAEDGVKYLLPSALLKIRQH